MSYVETLPEKAPVTDYVGDFLAARDENLKFVMAEFGHYDIPVAFQQPEPFTGDRAAIGIETWFRDYHGKAREAVEKQRDADDLEQNIFFLEYNAGLSMCYDSLGRIISSSGKFRPETVLPDEAVDETFASNVFGDENMANSRENTLSMLGEMSRLTSEEGRIVIRETISPRANPFLTKELFEESGLKLDLIIIQDATDDWERLEEVYNAENAGHAIMPFSFYMILSKDIYLG